MGTRPDFLLRQAVILVEDLDDDGDSWSDLDEVLCGTDPSMYGAHPATPMGMDL